MTDAETTITPVLRFPGEGGVGVFNAGRVRNEAFEKLAIAQGQEGDAAKREALVKAALREYREQTHMIPLHRQVIPWAVRSNVDIVHRPDNWLEPTWITKR